jgi:hypothetical protein
MNLRYLLGSLHIRHADASVGCAGSPCAANATRARARVAFAARRRIKSWISAMLKLNLRETEADGAKRVGAKDAPAAERIPQAQARAASGR